MSVALGVLLMSGSDDVLDSVGGSRGRGRPRKPDVPVPSWPVITGEMQLLHDAFKRAGEVVEVEVGRVPMKPETFVHRGPR